LSHNRFWRASRRSLFVLVATAIFLARWTAPASAGFSNTDEINLSGVFSGSNVAMAPNGQSLFVIVTVNGHGQLHQFFKFGLVDQLIQLGGAEPQYLVVAPDGSIYFTTPNTSEVVHVTNNANGATNFNPIHIPKLGANSLGTMTFDGQGNLNIATDGGSITQVTPAGVVTNPPASPSGTTPQAPTSGTPFQIPTPAGATFPPDALNLTTGPDGNIWFTETPT